MNNTLRNAIAALTLVGALALGACQTTDDDMDAPEAAPAEPTSEPTPTTPTTPTDPTTPPPSETPTDGTP